MSDAHPGCVQTSGGRYRPLIIVVHDGMYLYEALYASPEGALEVAREAAADGGYLRWHHHAMQEEEVADTRSKRLPR